VAARTANRLTRMLAVIKASPPDRMLTRKRCT
jgi:hypothetical protein